MTTLAVTGGIGSGKSAVTALLSEKGYPVFDCDASAKTLYQRDPTLLDRLEQGLGVPLRLADGSLDRLRLAGLIFGDASARAFVESLVHPAVLADFRAWRTLQHAPVIVLESALLQTAPVFADEYDCAILVEAPEEVRIDRIMRRDGCTREQALARMAVQHYDPSKVDAVLCNDGTLEDLSARLEELLAVLIPND